jgi:hypothetical protein
MIEAAKKTWFMPSRQGESGLPACRARTAD